MTPQPGTPHHPPAWAELLTADGLDPLTYVEVLSIVARLAAVTDEMPVARRALEERAGPAAVVRAAACAGNFQMMNRLLDAIGVLVSRAGMALARPSSSSPCPAHLTP